MHRSNPADRPARKEVRCTSADYFLPHRLRSQGGACWTQRVWPLSAVLMPGLVLAMVLATVLAMVLAMVLLMVPLSATAQTAAAPVPATEADGYPALSSATSPATSPATQGVESAPWLNTFGLQTLRELRAQPGADTRSVVISPLSLVTALTLLAQGASGDTASAFQERLTAPMPLPVAAQHLAELSAALQPATTDFTLQLANGVWLAEDLALPVDGHPNFTTHLPSEFMVRVDRVDFQNPAQREVINAWFAEQTADMLPEVLEDLPGDTVMVLGNAMYLKGQWLHAFDPEATRDLPFYRDALREQPLGTVALMQRNVTAEYRETETYQALRLPFADRDFELMVILPRRGHALEDLWTTLEHPADSPMLSGAFPWQRETIQLSVPRLDLRLGGDILQPLQAMGLMNTHEYAGISQDPIQIDQVVHKTALTLDEIGVEAAAATAVTAVRSMLPVDEIVFRADHPFVLALRHVPSSTLVLLGQVVTP